MMQREDQEITQGRVICLRISSTFYDLVKCIKCKEENLELGAKLQSPLGLDQSAIKFLSSRRMIT